MKISKKINNKIRVLIPVLLSLGVLVGWQFTRSYAKTALTEIKSHFRDGTPSSFELSRLLNLIEDWSGDIEGLASIASELELLMTPLMEKTEEMEKKIRKEETTLREEQKMLQSDLNDFKIAGRTYFRSEIQGNANHRRKWLQTTRKQVVSNKNDMQLIQEVIESCKIAIVQARDEQRRVVLELTTTRAELERLNLLNRVEDIKGKLASGISSTTGSETAKSVNQYKNRVIHERAKLNAKRSRSRVDILPQYNFDTPNESEAIDKYFENQ